MNMAGPLTLIMAAFAVISAVFTVMALVAVRRRRVIGTAMAMLLGLLCLTLAALAGSVSLATHGYQALTHEVVAARVATRVTGPQQFTATFTFADGRRSSFELTGDAIYVDARLGWEDPGAFASSLERLRELDARIVHSGHGRSFDGADLRTAIDVAMRDLG